MTLPVWLLVGLLALLVVLLSAWALVALNRQPDADCQAAPVWSHSGAVLEPVVTHNADGVTVTEWHARRAPITPTPGPL